MSIIHAEPNFCSHRQSYKQFCNFIPTIYSLYQIMQNICHFIIKNIIRIDITIFILENGTGAGHVTCSRISIKLCNICGIIIRAYVNYVYFIISATRTNTAASSALFAFSSGKKLPSVLPFIISLR